MDAGLPGRSFLRASVIFVFRPDDAGTNFVLLLAGQRSASVAQVVHDFRFIDV